MPKRFLKMGVLLLLLIILAGCAQHRVSGGHPAPDFIEFLSLEEFLEAYLIAKEGGNIRHLAETWLVDANPGNTLITSLETLHLPTNIPESFMPRLITITEYYVALRYVLKDVPVSSRGGAWTAILTGPSFEFSFTRMNDGTITFDGLMSQHRHIPGMPIDGRYFFHEPNGFTWISNGEVFFLRTPVERDENGWPTIMPSEIAGIPIESAYDLVRFTETRTVNLLDTEEILELISAIAHPSAQ